MRILSILILSLLLVNCSNDDDNSNNNNNDPIDPDPIVLPKLVAYEVGPNGTNVQYEYNDNELLEVWTETLPGFGFEITTAYNDELNPNVWYYIDSEGVSDQKGFFYDLQGRVFRYLDALDDVTLIYDNDNVVLFEGMIDEVTDVSGSMNLNSQGKVIRFNALNQYLTFDYDASGNMTGLNQFDNNDELIHAYTFSYDTKNNPFYGQYLALYLVRTIDLFWDFTQVNFTGFSGYVYPYSPNNLTVIAKDGVTTTSYLIGYDNDDYPAAVSEVSSGNSYQYDIIYITE